ncbi:MAG: ABC transporter permease subunit [Planctomycetes bacterium]|nr:ABC transporter permease subunit [Planctomycetota bacterium]
MTTSAPAIRARRSWRGPLLVAALCVLAAGFLPLDLSELWAGGALDRLGAFVTAFASPDLSAGMLSRCAELAVDTVAVALLGTALGLLLAWPLALLATRAVVLADGPRGLASAPARLLVEGSRFVLDVLRGVPDFVWAVVLASITGVNAVTGLLAIAISVAGIFGKVLSEQWDQVASERYVAVRSTGAGRLATFFYGLQPLASRPMLSFVLMRTECAVRNASVIGVVGGGGLGAGLWDEYEDGNWHGVATVLLTLLAVTAAADLVANIVRRRLRVDPNHPRADRTLDRRAATRRRLQVGAGVALALLGCVWWLRGPLGDACDELQRIEWGFVGSYVGGLIVPDLDAATLVSVARACVVAVAIGLLASVFGTVLAAALVLPASLVFQLEVARFTGERTSNGQRALRLLAFTVARAVALVLRGVPEAAWLVLLLVLLKLGPTPCVVAIALHSAGVLHRVFTESVDDVPLARHELVPGSPARAFLFSALPSSWAAWRTYAFFQFEVNLRAGVALGVVGAARLGHLFRANLEFRDYGGAAAFLWGMILLTVAVDRLSRLLQLQRNRC